MAENSRIEWTESTWNPITGCSKISDGCLNCYAARMAKRLQSMGSPLYKNEFKPTFHSEVLEKPLNWKKSRMIFVNSMSDTFHESIRAHEIKHIFKIMNKARWHTFQTFLSHYYGSQLSCGNLPKVDDNLHEVPQSYPLFSRYLSFLPPANVPTY